eukprot:5121488-Alexandrium_andersonii.AAC.1
MRAAIQGLDAAALLPQPTSGRVAVVRTKYLPAALFGVETTAIQDPLLRRLRTAVLAFVDPKMAKARNPLAALEALAAMEAE